MTLEELEEIEALKEERYQEWLEDRVKLNHIDREKTLARWSPEAWIMTGLLVAMIGTAIVYDLQQLLAHLSG